MDDLIAFLRARLDEDEQAATGCTPGPWLHVSRAEEAVFAGSALPYSDHPDYRDDWRP